MTKYVQDFLPNFLLAEARARKKNLEKENNLRRQKELSMHWLRYIQKCTDPVKRAKLISQYNMISSGRYRD